jgi:hypothetical protein
MRRRPLSLIAPVLLAVACEGQGSKQVDGVRAELASLKTPAGVTAADPQVSLGEMDAFGTQTYCGADEKAAGGALDSMLTKAGWEPVSVSGNAEATALGQYHKGALRAVLRLDPEPQQCGRRFRLELIAPL